MTIFYGYLIGLAVLLAVGAFFMALSFAIHGHVPRDFDLGPVETTQDKVVGFAVVLGIIGILVYTYL